MVAQQTKSLKDVVMEEYKKCASDPAYFMSKYCIIQHPIKGKILFKLWEFQTRTLRQFRDNRYNVVLKSRQLGISTLVAGYSLWLMLFHSDKNILVIATKQGVAKNLVTKVRVMHQNLPSWLKGSVVEDNKLSLRFTNGSQIKAEASSPDAGRSEALSLLVLDEAAFIDDINDIWASAALTLATGGDAVILSTPNGVGNLFHKIWQTAEEGKAFSEKFMFNPIKLHWTVHPERDQSWRKAQDELLGERLAAQECDCDFITSGNTVVQGATIKRYEDTMVKEPIEKTGIDHNLWIWEYPKDGRTYLVSADTSRGDGSDFQTAQVIDVENLVQVAEYRGLLGTRDFGNFLVNLSTQYNDALLVIENQNTGWAVIQQVTERSYKNLFYSSADLTRVDVETQVLRGNDMWTPQNTTKLIPGFSTTPKTRPLVVSKIDEYFRNMDMKVYSKRLVQELYTWVWQNGRADHLDEYNDDLIIAMGMGLLMRDTALRLKNRGIEMQKLALKHLTVTRPVYTNPRPFVDPYQMRMGSVNEDLRWLLNDLPHQEDK